MAVETSCPTQTARKRLQAYLMGLLRPNRPTWLTTGLALKTPSIRNRAYKLITMAALNWQERLHPTQDTISRPTIRALRLNSSSSNTFSSSKILSKTRIIDITINYIAIDMKEESIQIRKQMAISRWLSLLTTFTIMRQGLQTTATQEVVRNAFILTEG